MYTANSPKELKKLMEEDKFPILVTDETTIKVVEILESLKSKGVLPTAKDEIKKAVTDAFSPTDKKAVTDAFSPTDNIVITTTTVALVAVISATIIALYALYLRKNIKVKFGKNGPVLTTEG